MQAPENADLVLGDLGMQVPHLSPVAAAFMGEVASLCFHTRGHASGIRLTVQVTLDETSTTTFRVHWDPLSDERLRSWDVSLEGVEFGACGVALLLVARLTPYTAVARAVRGTGIDYWLGPRQDDDAEYPFQRKARLEVSGILDGDDTTIAARVRQKLRQTTPSDGDLPALVVVVEFGRPTSRMVRK